MRDYSKYDDKHTLNKDPDTLEEDTRQLYDIQTEAEVARVINRLKANPHMLRSVTTALAREVILKDETPHD